MPVTNNLSIPKPIQIGFIGLGQMGSGMATVLAKAGQPILLFDLDPTAASAIEAHGAISVKSLAHIAQVCDLIFMSLPGEDQVREVISDKKGLLATPGKLRTIVDTSTLSIPQSREFAQQIKDRAGINYCDCPVTGLPKRALEGSLTMMFGGSRDEFELAQPYLNVMGNQILHCGSIGSGQMMKSINNTIYNINIAGFCEVLPLAVKAGLDPLALETLLTAGSSRSFASEHFVPRILDRKFDDDFPMQSAYKDIINLRYITAKLDANIPLVNAMIESYEAALASGHGSEPKSAIVKIYEDALGITVQRPKIHSSRK